MNQCDGCRRGLPVVGGVHRGSGYDMIACTAELYIGDSDMNYVVMRSMFGNYWIGKAELEPNGVGVFATWDEAMEAAMNLWPDADNCAELEEEAETIDKDAERWIVT